MLGRSLSELSIDDVQALVRDKVPESRTLDFKREAIGSSDSDKREFAADVSAFANTVGGDLLLGVAEENGIASSVPGLQTQDPDAEILRMESILRSLLEPRLPSLETRWVPVSENRGVLVVRVRRSWIAPHRVRHNEHGRFFLRTSKGKHSMDVDELRTAFLASDGLVRSIRQFRQERLAAIEQDEGPVPLRGGVKVVLHLVPLSAFTAPIQSTLDRNERLLMPLNGSGVTDGRHTLEGYVTFSGVEGSDYGIRSYTLLYRSGIVEAVRTTGYGSEGQLVIPQSDIEGDIWRRYPSYLERALEMGVEPPVYLFLSILGGRGHSLFPKNGRNEFVRPKLRHDTLMLPEVVITDTKQQREEVLTPLFQLLWNAFGYEKSFSFDDAGRYTGD